MTRAADEIAAAWSEVEDAIGECRYADPALTIAENVTAIVRGWKRAEADRDALRADNARLRVALESIIADPHIAYDWPGYEGPGPSMRSYSIGCADGHRCAAAKARAALAPPEPDAR